MTEPMREPEKQAPVPQAQPGVSASVGERPGPANDTSKLLAALGYPLWLPVAIIAILIEPYKNEPFVKEHAMQGLGLGVAVFVVNTVLSFTGILAFVAPLIWLAALVYQIILAMKAWSGEYVEIPMLTEQLKKQFG